MQTPTLSPNPTTSTRNSRRSARLFGAAFVAAGALMFGVLNAPAAVAATSATAASGATALTVKAGSTNLVPMVDKAVLDAETGVAFRITQLPQSGGNLFGSIRMRDSSGGNYSVQTRVYATGTVQLSIKKLVIGSARTETTLSSIVTMPTKAKAGSTISLTMDVAGKAAATVSGSATIDSGATKTVTATDKSALPAGKARAAFYVSAKTPSMSVSVTEQTGALQPAPLPTTPVPPVETTPPTTTPPTVNTKPSATFRNASTTGVPAGKTLKAHHGDLVIREDGKVIDGLEVHGNINVLASNVVIKNTRVLGSTKASSIGMVSNVQSGKSFTIIDSEIASTIVSTKTNGIFGSNFTATRVNIHNVVDPIRIIGNNVTVRDSWLHGNIHMAKDPERGGTPTHDDSIQIEGGTNLVIEGNLMEDADNAAIQITQSSTKPKLGSVRIAGNFLNDGGCTVNIAATPSPFNADVSHNVFGADRKFKNCAVLAPTGNAPALTNNTWAGSGTTYTAFTKLN